MATIWRGMKPRVLFNAPAAAVSWGTYETMKDLLLRPDAQQGQHHHHH
jgi:solute carrier family 25 iron transporter 28/37